jgi:threonine dehydrogenase-like Zn-dependent dehydrogenase
MRFKAAVLTAPKKFEVQEVEIPPIGPNEMLVKIEACGICMSEMAYYLGQTKEKYPMMIGHEPAGTVVEVGKNVNEFWGDFKPGDRITGTAGIDASKGPTAMMGGCFAEYGVVNFSCKGYPPNNFVKIPDGIPVEYALGEPLRACVNISRACENLFGDYIFIVGCGFMGLATICGLAGRGGNFKELIACDLEENRLKLAKESGATITLNPNDVDVAKEVMRITKGRGVDVSIEAVGHAPALQLASEVTKRSLGSGTRAKLIILGWHHVPETYDLTQWIKGQVIHSAHPSFSLNQTEDLEIAMWALQQGIYPMEKLITHRFKLEDTERGFELSRSRADNFFKGVVMPHM